MHHIRTLRHKSSCSGAMDKISSVKCSENKVIAPPSLSLRISISLSAFLTVWLSSFILMSSSVMVKDEAPYAARCSFFFLFFLIEVSDFPQLHTCVKQMIMLLESFTVTLRRWIWGALSHHANVAALKNLPPLDGTIFAAFFGGKRKRLAKTDWKHSSLVNVNSQPHYCRDCYYYLFAV